ncbi:porin [Caballeronia glebae]|uniref:Porin n=1 Tax=Caballeronia glebae TaxID=1777143 RepID=A0A158AZ67_9BURK|nr:porin [Caballeronia glebae]SAK63281.1 porin [Caballeronia glebae]
MKTRYIAAACLLSMGSVCYAQSSVTLYGIIDTTLRYNSHANAAGDGQYLMSDGVIYGSRWGLKGVEDLGGGAKVIFVLENGFSPANGTFLQGGREFGRQSYVGLQKDVWGTLMLGRQYTVTHDIVSSHDPFALANLAIDGYIGGNYTGARLDNTVKYRNTYGPFYVDAAYTFGNVAGSIHTSSSPAIGLGFNSGYWDIGATYQVMNDVTTAYFNLPNPASQQKVWSLTGTWDNGTTRAYFGYVGSRLDVAGYNNDTGYVAVNQKFTPAFRLTAALYYDRMRHNNESGNRWTFSPMVEYSLSKATVVYAEADYTRLSGVWTTTAAIPAFQTPFYGRNSKVGAALGIRHLF